MIQEQDFYFELALIDREIIAVQWSYIIDCVKGFLSSRNILHFHPKNVFSAPQWANHEGFF